MSSSFDLLMPVVVASLFGFVKRRATLLNPELRDLMDVESALEVSPTD
jgi:hypothetical protein